MGRPLFESALVWVETHPLIALALVGAAGLAESLFLIGLFVPGALFMFAAGALIGANALPPVAAFTAAIAGSIAGDSASYLFGRRYRGRLEHLPGIARFPRLVLRGEDFFARHGGKAIIFGRLLGALRPIVPTVAGAAGLGPRRFACMDLLAVALWVPCYLLPGIVFGASLDLAAQVATRLAILLLVITVIVWSVALTSRYIFVAAQVAGRRYADRLIAWSRHHRRLGLLGPRLADPHQPELPALAVAGSVLMLACGLIYTLVWGWQPPMQPIRLDALLFYLGQSLQTPVSDTVARVVAKLGAPGVYLPFAVVITLALAVRGHRRAAGLWTAALVFSSVMTLLLHYWLTIPTPLMYFSGRHGPDRLLGGGQDLILCASVYGLAGTALAASQPPSLRSYYQAVTIAAIVMISLARLYLGLAWASDLLIALPLAFIWVNLLGLCYRRQRARPNRGMRLPSTFAAGLLLTVLLVLLPDRGTPPAWQPAPLSPSTPAGPETPDVHIHDLVGQTGPPLNVRAVGTRRDILATLAAAGWHAPPRLTAGQPLRWLSPDTRLANSAVLPRINNGRWPAITRVHAAPPISGAARRWVLRLWSSDHGSLDDPHAEWLGLADAQQLDRRLLLFSIALDQGQYPAALLALQASLDRIPATVRRSDSAAGLRLSLRIQPGPGASPTIPRASGVDATVTPD